MKSIQRFILLFFAVFSMSTAIASYLPRGSYLESCVNCSVSQGVLRCMCEAAEGELHYTRLYYQNCQYIENRYGRLSCDAAHRRNGFNQLPYGSYQKSCGNCYVEGSTLYCVCLNRRGYPANTSLNLYNCYRNNLDVINYGGRLACGNRVTNQSGTDLITLFLQLYQQNR